MHVLRDSGVYTLSLSPLSFSLSLSLSLSLTLTLSLSIYPLVLPAPAGQRKQTQLGLQRVCTWDRLVSVVVAAGELPITGKE